MLLCASSGYKNHLLSFFFRPVAKNSRKLTFLYLANDVIQNSKKKGPEFTKDFESVLVDACSHVARYSRCFDLWQLMSFFCMLCFMKLPLLDHLPFHSETDEGCKRQMERLLNIWKERSLYRADYIQQLKLAIEDNNSPIQRGSATGKD